MKHATGPYAPGAQRASDRTSPSRWGVGRGSQRTLPALRLRASAPTGACTRLRQPCAAPRGWRELGPARCGGGRPQSPRPISLQLRGPAPSGDTAGRAETPGRLPLSRGSQGEAGLTSVTSTAIHASKGRESMRDDLEPAPVGQWQPEVQVAEEDVGRDPSSRLPADARRSALQGASAADQHTGCGAGCPVVSELIEGATAAAGSGFKWQWEAQAPEEHAAEGVILQRELLACWQRRESEAAAWPSLGEQQSPRRSVKVRKGASQGPADPGCHKLPVAIPVPRRRNGSPHRWRARPRGPSTAARRIPLGAEQPQPGPPPASKAWRRPISIRASTRGRRSPMTGMASAQEAQ